MIVIVINGKTTNGIIASAHLKAGTRIKNYETADHSIPVGFKKFSFISKDVNFNTDLLKYYEDFAIGFINDFCEHTKNKSLTVVYEHLVNPEINGGCFIDGDIERIQIYHGTLFKLHHFASRLVNINKIINTKVTDNPDSDLLYGLNEELAFDDSESVTVSYEWVASSCKELNTLADYVAMVAVKFIILHEIGHILNGHLQYIQAKRRIKSFGFFMADNESKGAFSGRFSLFNHNIVNQILELDADIFAVAEIAGILERDLINDKELNEIVADSSDIYRMIGVALHCVFYLLGVRQNNYTADERSLQRKHPPISIRETILADTFIESMNDENREMNTRYFLEGLLSAHKTLHDTFKDADDINSLYEIFEDSNYESMLRRKFPGIKEELFKYMRYAL